MKVAGAAIDKVLSRAEQKSLNHLEVIKDPYMVLPCPGKALSSITHLNNKVSDAEGGWSSDRQGAFQGLKQNLWFSILPKLGYLGGCLPSRKT